jgi:hypothetical protein
LFCNPIELGPQQIARKGLVFVFDYGPDLRHTVVNALVNDRSLAMSLEIRDHVSGHKIEIPIPGEYRA